MQTEWKPTRREVVAGGAALAAAGAALGPAPASAASQVSGTVFEDRGGTGRRQRADPGIPGVLVSNGREVVRTNADGQYSLPIDGDSIVFVVKPTGFAPPVDPQTMLPRFYYIHQPGGSPDLGMRFRGLEPTGPLPASLDFPLTRTDEPRQFDVILFTDPQPESPAEVDFIRDDVVTALIGSQAAFGMTTGDLMFDDLSLYPRYNRIIGQIGLPWYNIGGNHDLNFEAPDRTHARETFKRFFGPPYFAFEYGGALFLMLDNVDYLGADPGKPGLAGKYEGRIGERQLAFIADVLKETPMDRLVVVAMHIPLKTYLDPKDPSVNTADRAQLLALLANRPSVSFSGHTHTTEHHYLDAADSNADAPPHHHHVMTAVSGSWWSGPFDHRGIAVADSRDGSPNGFHILSVDGNRYTTSYRAANEARDRQMRIVLDSLFHRADREVYRDVRMGQLLGSPIARDNVGATDVIVNFFDGGPKTRVEYTLNRLPAVSMRRVDRTDPFVEEVFARNEAVKKPWVKAERSSHIWVARLPADLAAGTHALKVKALDEYGREHRDSLIVEVI
jgi:3',5'-cyclic AMP phosphodiesterase CpdA